MDIILLIVSFFILTINRFTIAYVYQLSLPSIQSDNSNKFSDERIEIIKPNLIELNNESPLSSLNLETRQQNFLLTFNTRRKVFYGIIHQIDSSNPVKLEEEKEENNHLDDDNRIQINCKFYQGYLIVPDNGRIAATICSNYLFSTILLDDEIYVIRTFNLLLNHSIIGHDGNHLPEKLNVGTNLKEEEENNDNDLQQKNFPNESIKRFDVHYLYQFFTNQSLINKMRRKQIDIEPPLIDQLKEKRRRRRRRKRGLKRKLYNQNDPSTKLFNIETIIFVDQSLIRRFNGDREELQRLIFAIMNEVQLIYNFDTLNIRIRIIIKKIVYLDPDRDAPNTANGDIDQYLDNFCAWQKRLWKKSSPNSRWDHALMLTGLDLYKQINNEKNKKVLGLAWVNGMCRPSYSCTLNEGKNFESAFVIAHELAHSLGILHDGFDNNCDPDKFIMSEKTGPGKINWSPCSNLYLENFLRKTNLKCLEKTSDESFSLYTSPLDGQLNYNDQRLPGEQYSLNQQCQLALGNEYRAYITNNSPFDDICKELWCSHGNWASPAHPALEGSSCGKIKICSQGLCVDRRFLTSIRSKQGSYLNRHHHNLDTTEDPSSSSSSSDRFDNNNNIDNNSSAKSSSSSSASTIGTFMRKVQRFLKSTIRSIARLFSG